MSRLTAYGLFTLCFIGGCAAAPDSLPVTPAEPATSATTKPTSPSTVRKAIDTPGDAMAIAVLDQLIDRFENVGFENREQGVALESEFAAFAEQHEGTEAAVTARLWQIRLTPFDRDLVGRRERAARIARHLVTDRIDSPQLWELAERASLFAREKAMAILRRLVRRSPHALVRAHAQLALARLLSDVQDLDAADESRQGFGQLDEHYDLLPYRYTTFGAMGRAYLEPHDPDRLSIGERAPEITGKDLDGNEFRLSDYEGQVVLLRFWGDW